MSFNSFFVHIHQHFDVPFTQTAQHIRFSFPTLLPPVTKAWNKKEIKFEINQSKQCQGYISILEYYSLSSDDDFCAIFKYTHT